MTSMTIALQNTVILTVSSLFCSGAAQVVFHDVRVVELREQLEVEEEDGDRQG